jgi:hypothetical protein
MAAVSATSVGTACGTTLRVRSVPLPAFSAHSCASKSSDRAACEESLQSRYDAPGGIVVNQRTRYAVEVQARSDLRIEPSHDRTLVGIDHARLLSISYRRQPFASAKLVLALDGDQAVKTVGIEGEPGSVLFVESLGEAAAARREFREAEEKADDGE